MKKLTVHLLAAATLLAAAASAQTTTKVIFIGARGAWGGNNGDVPIQAFLEARYGKANVTYVDTEPNGNVKAETVLGYDVAVLSSTPSSGRYRNILHNSPVPIVNMEEAVADDTPVGQEFSITTDRPKEVELATQKIKITKVHPITAGFALNSIVPIMTGTTANKDEVWWSSGLQAPGATSLAQDDDTPSNLFITIVDVGGQLLDTGRTAECRRVMFGMTDRSFMTFTAEGKKLFGQAIDWAANGCCGQSSSYGTGLAGKNGIPTLVLTQRPQFNVTVNLVGSNSSGAPTAGVLLISKQAISVPVLGGTLLLNPTILLPLSMPATGFSFPWAIPDLSALCGRAPRSFFNWYFQLIQLDSAAKQGWSFTSGLRAELGK